MVSLIPNSTLKCVFVIAIIVYLQRAYIRVNRLEDCKSGKYYYLDLVSGKIRKGD